MCIARLSGLVVCAVAVVFFATLADADMIGVGIQSYSSLDTAGSPRVNIDRTASLTLAAGDYTMDSLSLNWKSTGGVLAFLAILQSENTAGSTSTFQVIALANTVGLTYDGTGTDAGTFSLTGASCSFHLSSATTVYAGFESTTYSTNTDGSNPVTFASGSGTTAHNPGAMTIADGASLTFTTYRALGRAYSFGIDVASVPEPAVAALLLCAAGCFTVRYMRRKRG